MSVGVVFLGGFSIVFCLADIVFGSVQAIWWSPVCLGIWMDGWLWLALQIISDHSVRLQHYLGFSLLLLLYYNNDWTVDCIGGNVIGGISLT